MRDPRDQYDAGLNEPTANQENAARAVFEFVQALRLEASEFDPDSPGELTVEEIFSAAIQRAPGAAMALVSVVKDEHALGDDITEIAHIVVNQLDPFDVTAPDAPAPDPTA